MRLVAQCLALFVLSWARNVGAAETATCGGTLAINSSDDVTKLNQCTTFVGNVSLAAKGIENIALNGVKEIIGSISIADSAAITSISSSTLETLSGLMLYNLPNLSTLALPALANFTKLDLQGLTSLKRCEIASTGLKADVSEISVIGTALEELDWIKWPVAATLTLANNPNLTEFALPYEKINGGSSYQITGNSRLTNLDFSQVTGIAGSLAIGGNKERSLNFDKLETIDGYVKLSGPLSNITMPRLVSINGALRAESTVDILAFCNWLSVQGRLYGHYDCTANNTNPAPIVTSSVSKVSLNTATPTSVTTANASNADQNGKSTLSTGVIIGIAMAMVVFISIILTSLALLFFRRRSQKKKAQRAQQEQQQQQPTADEKKTHSTSTLGEELDASGTRYELGGGGHTTQELPEARAATELDGHTFQEMDVENEKPFFRDQKPAKESPAGRFELP